jgi:hypothetical protein
MGLRQDVEAELLRLMGSPMPCTLTAREPSGLELRLELNKVDQLGCALAELALFVPALQGAAFDVLKQWSQSLSQKITYLLESLGPLEFDPQAGTVLIRSTPPDQLANGTRYYEIMLSSQGAGTFSLRRYRSTKGQPGRDPVDLLLTQEVILKLVDDLINTIPSNP